MRRRTFLTTSALAVTGLVAGGVAVRRASLPAPSSELLVNDLRTLRAKRLESSGAWSPYKVFTHLSQSVDYSMTGYPEMKSDVFQNTIGRAAYFAFSTAGSMRHDLAEPIPGAPVLANDGPTVEAIDRLIESLTNFEAFAGKLQPHFAYGDLTRDQYRAAHIFHVSNHFDEITSA